MLRRPAPYALAVLACALSLALTGAPVKLAAEPAHAAPTARGAISGGHAANPARWPYATALFMRGRFHCGGSVIAPTTVLTAAHCVRGFRIARMTAVIGRPNLRNTARGERFEIVAQRIHPDYAGTRRHDLAVLTLSAPTSAEPIALPSPEQGTEATGVGDRLRAAGWGAKDPFGTRFPGFLKRASQQVPPNWVCRRAYGLAFSLKTMVCAQGGRIPFRFGLRGAPCSGDSGGPLVADTPAGPLLVGVVSYSSFICGLPGAPTVYARVSDGLDFISGG